MLQDPYPFFKDLFASWQKPAAEFWEAYLRSPLYLETLKRTLDTSLESQKTIQDFSEAWWRAWGLSTRHDQEWTRHHLNEIDTQLRRLARRIDKLAK